MKTKYQSLLLRWKYIFICVILFPHIIVAQEFFPLNNNPTILTSYQQTLEQRFKSSVGEVKGINSKYILEEYQKRYDYLKKMYEKKLLVTDTLANNYLNKITNRIIESNPILQQLKPAIYFSRAWWPNATSYGEGTILFNISLF